MIEELEATKKIADEPVLINPSAAYLKQMAALRVVGDHLTQKSTPETVLASEANVRAAQELHAEIIRESDQLALEQRCLAEAGL